MALKRFPNLRLIRQNIPLTISFVIGTLFGLLFMCSRQKSPYGELLKTSSNPHVTGKPIASEIQLSSAKVDNLEHPTEQTTDVPIQATKEAYPPLIKKEGLLITPELSCPENLLLLILVVTSSRNFHARKAIRRSWGPGTLKNDTASESFRVVYVLGSDGENDRLITREAKRYRDILRGGFADVYRQIEDHTVKPLFGFKWTTSSCKAKFVLKVSSESFVNVPELISFLQKRAIGGDGLDLYMGFCHGKNIGGVTAVRNSGSQWYVSENEWPEPQLPPYASSMGILMSYDVIERIVELSVKEKLIHIDDVYLGIMAHKLSIACEDQPSKFDISYTTMLSECEDLSFCVLGSVPSKDMFYLHQNANNLREIC